MQSQAGLDSSPQQLHSVLHVTGTQRAAYQHTLETHQQSGIYT